MLQTHTIFISGGILGGWQSAVVVVISVTIIFYLRLEPGKLAGCSAPQSVEHLRALLDEGVGAGPFQMNLEKQQGFLFGLPFRLSNCNLFKHQGLPFGEPFT